MVVHMQREVYKVSLNRPRLDSVFRVTDLVFTASIVVPIIGNTACTLPAVWGK